MNLDPWTISLAVGAGGSIPMLKEWQDPATTIWQMAIVGILVFLNGFFVASEFAIVKVRGSQLEALQDETTGGAKVQNARHVTGRLDAYLSATQLGITLASLGLGIIGNPYISALVTPAFFALGVTDEKIIGVAADSPRPERPPP